VTEVRGVDTVVAGVILVLVVVVRMVADVLVAGQARGLGREMDAGRRSRSARKGGAEQPRMRAA
jgi:hypothetical protein